MQLRARVVLDDCRGALRDLRDGVQGDEWRRRWVTAVVLLRAVGHVLMKVDSQTDAGVRAASGKKWAALQKSKPDPKIFWQFIDDERNLILKEYVIRAGQGVTVNLAAEIAHSYPVHDGPFAGMDQREVIRIAIDWWNCYLGEVENEAFDCQTTGRS